MSESGFKQVQQRVSSYYNELVDAHGYSHLACDASGRQQLVQRYEQLMRVADLDGSSVLDVGCGFGDLGLHVLEHYPGVDYNGVDISEKMVEVGVKTHPQLQLQVANLMDLPAEPSYDYVMSQGVFYLLGEGAEALMEEMIAQMFALCRRGVAFCTLSALAPFKHEGEFYADPAKVTAFCSTLTPNFVLKHDYLDNDFTVYLYRTDAAG